ncbi:hypothetical protein EDD18DRAFT_1315381 [Armillaria luteobubalina]|uniref:Uncharacterized protein n=1 Tax=Armillaria luteobubalina TaxID=153913 RepID=A0AA39U4Y8_9AGAR|nr:hypothetical protein EDD18DRAFT_1315381 [Armillaria luteobubalina]
MRLRVPASSTSSFIDKPWHPFASENDFELAELILRTGMNRQERDSYFKVLKTQAGDHQSAYTINNESDLNDAWSQAEHLLVMLSLEYGEEIREYMLHFWPLWDWTLNLLSDPTLSSFFVWDAVKIFQLDEKTNTRMRIFDEPWTGDLLWKIQSSLPPGGKPLAYILYADKTRLSSFGTAKGYPVMARIANLPDAIRNGKGWGGGTVVGWLPIVEEDPKHKGKPSWINFKRVVWHESFCKILESVAEYSYTGYAFTLPHSGETIVIYPFIFILLADYEEHCMMSLIRGVRSSCPCPVCLVPDKKLMDITEVYPLRTTENMQKLYDQAQEKGDSILQSSGLRDVENVFWSIEHSDPYRAVSWDRLHAYHLGLFKHLLLRLLEHVENIQGPDKHKAKVIIDEFIANFPRWQNLIHFPNVTTFDFSDALKYENMSKQILFAAHSVLSKADNPNAYLLLKLDMYTSMDVHTEKSIEEGRQLLGVFEANLKAYSQATDDTIWKNVTSWSIPKVHTQQHLFDDIIAKGVTKNYNTKVNECMHGPLKEAYQTRTNFKNVADQILMTDHRYGIAMKLRQRMDRNKKHQKEAMASVEQETKVSSKAKRHNRQMQNIQPLDSKASLHSLQFTPRDPRTLEELEAAFHSDPAYERFRIRLGLFMTTFLNMVEKGTVAAGNFIQYQPNDMIQIYHTLTVNYQSLVNFKKSTDLLRCNPSFYNNPRYDGVIINTDRGVYIGRLIQLFECEYLEQKYPLALVHPFDITVTDGRQRWKHQHDRDLGFYRVRARPRVYSQFVSIYAIIRGVLLVEDNSSDLGNGQDYFVVDTIDSDMFFRMKKIKSLLKYQRVDTLKKD